MDKFVYMVQLVYMYMIMFDVKKTMNSFSFWKRAVLATKFLSYCLSFSSFVGDEW
jgi:hypothetical protein